MNQQKKKKSPLPFFIIIALVIGYFMFPALKNLVVPKTIEETIYSTYGKYKPGSLASGIFKIDDANPDYTRTIWYRTTVDEQNGSVKQVGSQAFSYSRLKSMFSNKNIDNFLFVFCYELLPSGYDKVLMASIDRPTFDRINSQNYDSDDYLRYVVLQYADTDIFPSIQSYVRP